MNNSLAANESAAIFYRVNIGSIWTFGGAYGAVKVYSEIETTITLIDMNQSIVIFPGLPGVAV